MNRFTLTKEKMKYISFMFMRAKLNVGAYNFI